jgi:hypothetical protein
MEKRQAAVSIKAIETTYNGYRFRSRLEARWAVFMDRLGVPYRYEPQGYQLPSGLYLPDFYLPKLQCWVEVKPGDPSALEGHLAADLAAHTGQAVYVFFGDCWRQAAYESESAHVYLPRWVFEPSLGGGGGHYETAWDAYHLWCVCPDCGSVGIEFEGRSDRLGCKECEQCAYYDEPENAHFDGADYYNGRDEDCHCAGKCPRGPGNHDGGETPDHPRILAAYAAARSARFEHGETPRPR